MSFSFNNQPVSATVSAMIARYMDQVKASDYDEPTSMKSLFEGMPAAELEMVIDQYMVPALRIARAVLDVKRAMAVRAQKTGEMKQQEVDEDTDEHETEEDGEETDSDDEDDPEFLDAQSSADGEKDEDHQEVELLAEPTASAATAEGSVVATLTAPTVVTVCEEGDFSKRIEVLKEMPGKKTSQHTKLWNEFKINEKVLIKAEKEPAEVLFYKLGKQAGFSFGVTFSERSIRPVVRIAITDVYVAKATLSTLTELDIYATRPAMTALLCVVVAAPSLSFPAEFMVKVEVDVVPATMSTMIGAAIGLAEVGIMKMGEKRKCSWEGKSEIQTDASAAVQQAADVLACKKAVFVRSA